MGLNPQKQKVTWEEQESNKKQKVKEKKKGANRYFSTTSCQLLTSEPPVSTLPTTPENTFAIGASSFLALCDNEEKAIGGQTSK